MLSLTLILVVEVVNDVLIVILILIFGVIVILPILDFPFIAFWNFV